MWVSYRAGNREFVGHQMRSASHVALRRGSDYLLVNSGQWHGTGGYWGTQYSFRLNNYDLNTLFVNDYGAYMFTGEAYQGPFPPLPLA